VTPLSMNDLTYIGLGSNLGDCRQNLTVAQKRMESCFATAAIARSAVYRSEPVELTDQPCFFNQVVAFRLATSLGPLELLAKLKAIEVELGRTPGIRYGPRVIDLDIIFYRNWVFQSEALCIPHPKIERRSFVLRPLAEIASQLLHPRTGQSMAVIWAANRDKLSWCEPVAELP
jgi:2-amino-4-hydroxy-6-hydroxymethyldihydropteridine diphosphokinase